jgi:hypothetical protein
MLGRFAAAAALIVLASCAGMEPAGRNATRGEPSPVPAAQSMPRSEAPIAPPPSYVPPPPAQQAQAQAPVRVAQPSVAAPSVSVETPAPPPARDPDADVTVQAPARQVQAPRGDPRSVSEQREDAQNWDHCVLSVQQTISSDPTEPVLESPEDVCRRQLGQASRYAVPTSRMIQPH